jgi:hypothetical protein
MTVSSETAEKFRSTLEKMSYPHTDISVYGGNHLSIYIDTVDEANAKLWDSALRRVAAATGKPSNNRFAHSIDYDDEYDTWTVSATI